MLIWRAKPVTVAGALLDVLNIVPDFALKVLGSTVPIEASGLTCIRTVMAPLTLTGIFPRFQTYREPRTELGAGDEETKLTWAGRVSVRMTEVAVTAPVLE